MSADVQHSSGANSPINSKEGNCTPLAIGRMEDMNNVFKEKLDEALAKNNEMWRKHEKEQINYVQTQNSQMLNRLHTEIERLQNINRDLERRLYVSSEPELVDSYKTELRNVQISSDKLKRELANAENRNRVLAQTLEESAKLYKDQVNEHETRIRQLSNELDHRTLTITQLSTQLRNFKLREAMANAQQRRRLSCIEPLKQIPPVAARTSGFRLFAGTAPSRRVQKVDVPGSGAVVKPNASVSVSYPHDVTSTSGIRRLPFINSVRQGTSENNIEKPSITRSLSSNIPPTKSHLIQSLRNAQDISSNIDKS
ncbi:CCDC92 domain-containing protein [Aphelenchoides besseyi]|nr:CCDC92 domain-containing protein [Aphelenchoides besseyi]